MNDAVAEAALETFGTVGGTNVPSSHIERFMKVLEFLGQAFVERKCTSLGASISNHASRCEEARHACDGDNVTMIVSHHAWDEFSDEEEMRDGVDIEDAPDSCFGSIGDGTCTAYTGVVNQDGRISMLLADCGRYRLNIL